MTIWYTTIAPLTVTEGTADTAFGAYNTTETMTIAAGVITVGDEITFAANGTAQDPVASVTVAAGATLVVPADVTLTSNGMTVEGTVSVQDQGAFDANANTVINGTVDIAAGGSMTAAGVVITGTVNVAQTEEDQGTFTVDGTVTLGEKPETLSADATGAIVGKVSFPATGAATYYIKAYAGADMSGAVFAENEGVNTEYYINDVLYMTVYAEDTTNAPVISTVGSNATEKYDMPAYNTDNIEYKDAEGAALQNKAVGTIDAVYATVKVNNAPGTISEGNGLTMYIDGLTLANFGREPTTDNSSRFQLSVGTHTVSIAAQYGYEISNATITFNGQTVQNGGTIEVTADMVQDGFTLAASGAVPASTGGGSTTVVSGDDGMGLTDYLLIILVILIVVMAIMVAMRLMRS